MDIQNSKKLHDICLCLYGVYAACMILQFSFKTMILGTVAMIIALFVTYSMRKKTKDTLYASHIQWMLRTFWIGGGVYMPILTIIGAFYVSANVDYNKMYDTIASGAVADPMMLANTLMEENKSLMFNSMLITTLPFALWWVYRCWKGYTALRSAKPVDNVLSWI